MYLKIKINKKTRITLPSSCKNEYENFGVSQDSNNIKKKKMFFSSNSLYIFLLDVNFENIIVGLHVLIISFMLAKFQRDQKSISMLSIKYLNFKFL